MVSSKRKSTNPEVSNLKSGNNVKIGEKLLVERPFLSQKIAHKTHSFHRRSTDGRLTFNQLVCRKMPEKKTINACKYTTFLEIILVYELLSSLTSANPGMFTKYFK